MANRRALHIVRGVLPWVAGWFGLQAVVAVAGRLAARRLNEGDDTAARIRRVMTMGGVELRPTSPTLARVELDLMMAGAQLDLTGMAPLPGGVDVVARMVMGGVEIRVPRDWQVWWEFRGVGGVSAEPDVQRTTEWVGANLRLDARAVFGGVGIKSAGS